MESFIDWKTEYSCGVSFCKPIYKFIAIPIKIPSKILVEIYKLFPKFMWEGKGTRIAKMNLKIKNHMGGRIHTT